MFDIDGTLTLTNDVDARCYMQAMSEHLGFAIDDDWSHYRHVTDSVIAAELFDRHQRPGSQLPTVRDRFVALLGQALAADAESCRQVAGADAFLRRLREMPGTVVGLTTGGWAPSALAKLRHAGIDASGLAFASADDAPRPARRSWLSATSEHSACPASNVLPR
jgi:beta-phosphoglucomutase-like phosphatase (HAD superfamily)